MRQWLPHLPDPPEETINELGEEPNGSGLWVQKCLQPLQVPHVRRPWTTLEIHRKKHKPQQDSNGAGKVSAWIGNGWGDSFPYSPTVSSIPRRMQVVRHVTPRSVDQQHADFKSPIKIKECRVWMKQRAAPLNVYVVLDVESVNARLWGLERKEENIFRSAGVIVLSDPINANVFSSLLNYVIIS